MLTPETRVKNACLNYLKEKHIWARRYQAQYNASGLPDADMLYFGIYVGLEFKAPNGKPTELQLRKLHQITLNGGLGCIVKSINDIDDIIFLCTCYLAVKGKYRNIKEYYDALTKSGINKLGVEIID